RVEQVPGPGDAARHLVARAVPHRPARHAQGRLRVLTCTARGGLPKPSACRTAAQATPRVPSWRMRHEPADPTLACIYCRQREDCEALAAQLGLTVVQVYTDNDLSAYSGKPRPDYARMLDAIRHGRYGTVLAWHTDRLHRSPTELEEYIDVCEPRAVQTRT